MKTKFYWHIHHDVLLEPLTEPLKNRIKFIKENKPKDEIELRLKLLKPVRGKLPDEIIKAGRAYDKAGKAYIEAGRSYDKAWEAYVKTWEVYDKAGEAYVKAREAYDKSWEAYVKAWEAYDKAGRAYDKAGKIYDKTLKKYSKEINELHEKECPNCPWQNGTIFSNKI